MALLSPRIVSPALTGKSLEIGISTAVTKAIQSNSDLDGLKERLAAQENQINALLSALAQSSVANVVPAPVEAVEEVVTSVEESVAIDVPEE